MSRVAKNPVPVPAGVAVNVEGRKVQIKGSKGVLALTLHPDVVLTQEAGAMHVGAKRHSRSATAMAGTSRALLQNMVVGVSEGFVRKLELVGVGYRAQLKGDVLSLSLGYSHGIDFPVPDGVAIETPSQTEILVKGVDKQQVGQVAAVIRRFRSPEPYKGKGIRYAGEQLRMKEAKKK